MILYSALGPTLLSLVLLHVTQVVYVALTVYDAIVSLAHESKCVWGRRFGFGTILYFLIRYGTIVNLFLQVIGLSGVLQGVIVSFEV